MGTELWPYQARAVKYILKRLPQAKTLLCVSPVATGKTTIFSECARRWAARGKRVLVLVHHEELLKQAHARLAKEGVPAGIIWRDHAEEPQHLVQVASLWTLYKRKRHPPADFVIVDEAHHTDAASWRFVIGAYPLVAGFTATPIREGGAPVDSYSELYEAITNEEAVRKGYLCPYEMKVYKTEKIDLASVKRVGGEFATGALGEAMSKRQVVGDIVDRWRVHAKNRSTLVFAATVAQSKGIMKAFRRVGVVAYHLDANSTNRAEVLARFNAGEFPVLCNVDLFGEGTDIPRVKCIVLARPTHSLAKYMQQIGRGRRPWPSRENSETCLILDHGGLLGPHGLPDKDRHWSAGAGDAEANDNVVCSKCGTARERGTKCPNGCVFNHEAGETEIDWVPHGYEYDAEQLAGEWEAKRKEAVELHINKHVHISEVARRLDTSYQNVASWIRALGHVVEYKRHVVGDKSRELARDAVKSGDLTLRDAAKKYGPSESAIRKDLRAIGLDGYGRNIADAESQRAEVLRLGKTKRFSSLEISRRTGVKLPTVGFWLAAAKLNTSFAERWAIKKRATAKTDREYTKRLTTLYKTRSLEQVANEVGKSLSHCYEVLKRAGVVRNRIAAAQFKATTAPTLPPSV